MNKRARSYRLHPTALEHLSVLQTLTGSTQASLIEQALAVYRALLQEGVATIAGSVRQDVSASEGKGVDPELAQPTKRQKAAAVTTGQSAMTRVQSSLGPLFDA